MARISRRATAPRRPERLPNRLIGLEALRFLAACAILVHHYPYMSVPDGSGGAWIAANAPFQALLGPVYDRGWTAVQMFWCISGFIFAWKYSAPIAAGAVSFRRFAILRLSRLYPLHLVTLLAVAVLQMIHWRVHGMFLLYPINDFRHFALNLCFAQFWGFEGGMSFNGPSWSVSLELLVYALFFASCWLVGGRARLMVPVAFAVFAVSVFLWSAPPHPNVFQAAVYFQLGVLASHLYAFILTRRRADRIACTGMIALVVAVPMALAWFGVLDRVSPNPIVWVSVVLLFQLAIPDGGRRFNRLATGLGDLTYGSYLLHFPVQLAIVLTIGWSGARIEDLVPRPWFFLGYLALVLTLSRLVFLWFERPAQSALRRALLGRRIESDGALPMMPAGEA